MPVEGLDYTVRVIPFPNSAVKAFISVDDADFFSIYINSLLSKSEQESALKHELQHIVNDDFYNGKSIEAVEDWL